MSEFTLELTFKINWFWLYNPADSISAARPGLPQRKDGCRGAGRMFPAAFMSSDRSMCSPCELANVIATVVLNGSSRSNPTADCIR